MFTDTPDGQTHSYNDGCGDRAHNESWEEQLAELLIRADVAVNYPTLERDIFIFIRTLLAEREAVVRKEERKVIKNFVFKDGKVCKPSELLDLLESRTNLT